MITQGVCHLLFLLTISKHDHPAHPDTRNSRPMFACASMAIRGFRLSQLLTSFHGGLLVPSLTHQVQTARFGADSGLEVENLYTCIVFFLWLLPMLLIANSKHVGGLVVGSGSWRRHDVSSYVEGSS